jgi:ankyrin repeat protein
MTFDRTSLDRAISNLENAQPSQNSTLQELGDLIGQITQAGTDENRSAATQLDGSAHFEQLAELAIAGNSEIFSQLLAAEQISRKENQPTLLMSAVMAGKTEIVRALVDAGVDVNIRVQNFIQFDALYFAVDGEQLEIVKLLIDAGADLEMQSSISHSTTQAISKNNAEILKTLLDAGAKTYFEYGSSLLVQASRKADIKIIQLLLDVGCGLNEIDPMGDTPLISACLSGRDLIVDFLLQVGADPNLPRRDGMFPLFAAFSMPGMIEAFSGFDRDINCENIPERMMNIIQLLLNRHANPNVFTYMGITPLMIAAEQGFTKITQDLIKKGAEINAIEDFSRGKNPCWAEKIDEYALAKTIQLKTSLIFAAENGHTEIVAELLKAGADVTIADRKNRLPIDIAIQEGYTEIVQLLQNAGAKAEAGSIESSPAALLGAAKQGNLDILKLALQAGIDPNTSELEATRNPRHKTALMFAAERGHQKIVEHLILAGVDINLSDRPGKKLGKTPLMYAGESGYAEIVELLLRSGAIVDAQDKRGQTALYYAVESDRVEAVQVLLKFGADPHKKNWDSTPFERATYSTKEIVALITSNDRSPGSNVSNKAKEEMLRSASFSGYLGIVRELIFQSVDLNAQQNNGFTALMYAAARGNLDILQILLAAGADVNIKERSGATALSQAAAWEHLEIVSLLLSAGAEVNGIDNEEGSAPLINAICSGRIQIVKILLDAGANPNLRDENGKTAIEIAIEHQKLEIADFLRQID